MPQKKKEETQQIEASVPESYTGINSTYKVIRYHRLLNLGNYENEAIDIEEAFSKTMPDHVCVIMLKQRVEALKKGGFIGKNTTEAIF